MARWQLKAFFNAYGLMEDNSKFYKKFKQDCKKK